MSWTRKAERGSTGLIHLVVWLARRFGRPPCRLLLYPIVLYFLLADGAARRASAQFLSAARARPARWRDVFVHLHSFAATLLDRVYMAAGEFHRFEVTIEGQALVDEALRAGHGCVLLGSHLGSFDLMLLAPRTTQGRRVSVLMRVDPRARLRQIAGIDDARLNVIALGRPQSYLQAHEELALGGLVGVLADRVDGGPQLPVQFLGRRAAMPTAPHVLAARSGAAVLLCFGLYEGANRYRIEFVPFGRVGPCTLRGAALQPVVDRYAALLEDYARRYPMNWFNFYPYWAATEGVA